MTLLVLPLLNSTVNPLCLYGWGHPESTLELPDPDGRHVLATVLAADADCIVTYNLKDFPTRSLERYAVEAVHPDEFLSMMLKRGVGFLRL